MTGSLVSGCERTAPASGQAPDAPMVPRAQAEVETVRVESALA